MRAIFVLSMRKLCANFAHRTTFLTMAKATQSSPVNLYLHGELVKVAKTYAEKNRKARSLSHWVEMLIVRELRAKGLKLPEEFSAKAA